MSECPADEKYEVYSEHEVMMPKKKSRFLLWLDMEIKYALKEELKNVGKNELDKTLNEYVKSVYKSAKQLATLFDKQQHSGMSAQLTIKLFKKMANWENLSPLTLEDDEFGTMAGHDQNQRNSAVFRNKDKNNNWQYSYIYIVSIKNENEVWLKYPPIDDCGTLDDNDPLVENYFKKLQSLKDKHNDEIKAPYTPKTHYYNWDFKKKDFVNASEKVEGEAK